MSIKNTMLATNHLDIKGKQTQFEYDSVCFSKENNCSHAKVKGVNIEYWRKNGQSWERICILRNLFEYFHNLLLFHLHAFVDSNSIKDNINYSRIKVGCLWNGNKIQDIVFREVCYTNHFFIPVILNYVSDDPEIISYKLFVAECQILLYDVDIHKTFIDEILDTFSSKYGKKILVLSSERIFSSNGFNEKVYLNDHLQEIFYSNKTEKPIDANGTKDMLSKESFNLINKFESSIIHQKLENIELDRLNLNIENLCLENDTNNKDKLDADNNSKIRNIIFTSGSTGKPKGVKLTFGNYSEMINTFSVLYKNDNQIKSIFVVTNPLHHINSTCFTEYCIRSSSKLVLIHKYSKEYWLILNETIKNSINNYGRDFIIIVPLVPKHFEYFYSMIENNYFQDKTELLKNLSHPSVNFFFGSSAVSSNLINIFKELFNGKIPRVRFGSTETCLQLCGTDLFMNNSLVNMAYKIEGECCEDSLNSNKRKSGHFIGRSIQPFAEIFIVKSIDLSSNDFLVPTDEFEVGHIICRGKTVMNGYINHENVLITREILDRTFNNNSKIRSNTLYICDSHPWYIGLGDQGYWISGETSNVRTSSIVNILGEEKEVIHLTKSPRKILSEKLNLCGCCDSRIILDNIFLFWISRSSSIIKIGGVKYSSEEINNRIVSAIKMLKTPALPDDFFSTVISNKDNSISNDDKILFVYEPFEGSEHMKKLINSDAIKSKIPKQYIPYKIIEATIPKTFKGSINYEKLLEKINY
ncbi:putative acyl-CoA synthetase [Cryptosporidium canis]|uniref:Acyl-CoA synthetase n=1 Tax=Cryptosporidium canis TaxID=195482 RepID=A0A9D5DFR6_9CRYT|nr:putative acyl-CoA synthetase [Cryptosporidium canis]